MTLQLGSKYNDYNRFEKLAEGEICNVIVVSIDVEGSSSWVGPTERVRETRENLSSFLHSAMCGIDMSLALPWSGDGGAFIFLIKKKDSYDRAVLAAEFALYGLAFFNSSKPYLCRVDVDAAIRICCGVAQVNFSSDPGHIKGEDLDFLLKHERSIGIANKLVVTAGVYDQIYEPSLRSRFRKIPDVIVESSRGQRTIKRFCCDTAPSSALRRYRELRTANNLFERLSTYDDIFERQAESVLRKVIKDLEELSDRRYAISGANEIISWLERAFFSDEIVRVSIFVNLSRRKFLEWEKIRLVERYRDLLIRVVDTDISVRMICSIENTVDAVASWGPVLADLARHNVSVMMMKVKEPVSGFCLVEDADHAPVYQIESSSDSSKHKAFSAVVSGVGETFNPRTLLFESLWNASALPVQIVEQSGSNIRSIAGTMIQGQKNSGTSSIIEVFGENIYLRAFRPVTPKTVPRLKLCARASLDPETKPRKCDLAYSGLVHSAIEETLRATPVDVLYFGDSLVNDGTVIENLQNHFGLNVYGFLCNESAKEAPQLSRFGPIFISNRWGQIYDFCEYVFPLIDWSRVVAIFDMDKTIYAASGRNGFSLQLAREEAVFSVCESLFDTKESIEKFEIFYRQLDNPEFHPLTHDNQDYLVFVGVMLAAQLVSLETLRSRLQGPEVFGFRQFFGEIAGTLVNRGGNQKGIPSDIRNLVDEFSVALQENDPTPFKSFRTEELRRCISRAMLASEGKIAESIHLTSEIVGVCEALKRKDVPIFIFSDRPEECTFSEESEENLLNVEMAIVGADLTDSLMDLLVD